MTKFIEQMAQLLPTPQPQAQPEEATCRVAASLSRREVEALFARELGRSRLN